MTTALSLDIRTRIFNAVQSGESCSEAAERFEVSPAFVRRLMQRHRQSGTLAPKTGPRGRKPLLDDKMDDIRKLLAEQPDLTAGEVREQLKLDVCVHTVWRAIRRLDNTFKKRISMALNASERMSKPSDSSGRK